MSIKTCLPYWLLDRLILSKLTILTLWMRAYDLLNPKNTKKSWGLSWGVSTFRQISCKGMDKTKCIPLRHSPMPILFVCKKEGMFQICIDFRILNKQTKKWCISNSLNWRDTGFLYKAQVFSRIDLSKVYHQVAIEPSFIGKTAFFTKYGFLNFLVLLFDWSVHYKYFNSWPLPFF